MLGMRGYTPKFIDDAKKAKFKGNYILQILIFIAVFLITNIVSSMIPVIIVIGAMIPKIMESVSSLDVNSPSYMQNTMELSQSLTNDIYSNSAFLLSTLFATVITTVLVIIYCRFIEKRSLGSMGFVKKKSVSDYLIGIVIGFSIYALALAINFFTGSVEYNGMVMTGGIGLILLFALGFFFQGMSEEVVLRGYFMSSLSIKSTVIVAVITNSVVFGLLHAGNPGVTVFALINIALFGVFMSVYMLKTGSIWGVCAIHSVWNFVQGNIFGGYVSGLNPNSTVFSFTPVEGKELWSGGSFGFEGGLAVTIILAVAIAVTAAIKPRKLEEK